MNFRSSMKKFRIVLIVILGFILAITIKYMITESQAKNPHAKAFADFLVRSFIATLSSNRRLHLGLAPAFNPY